MEFVIEDKIWYITTKCVNCLQRVDSLLWHENRMHMVNDNKHNVYIQGTRRVNHFASMYLFPCAFSPVCANRNKRLFIHSIIFSRHYNGTLSLFLFLSCQGYSVFTLKQYYNVLYCTVYSISCMSNAAMWLVRNDPINMLTKHCDRFYRLYVTTLSRRVTHHWVVEDLSLINISLGM